MRRLLITITALVVIHLALPQPAFARQVDCARDTFDIEVNSVRFTPETTVTEQNMVMYSLATTDVNINRLSQVLGRPLTISVNGDQNFAFPKVGQIVLQDNLNIRELGTLLMHEIGHVWEANIMTDKDRETWAFMNPGIIAYTYSKYGWIANDAPYFDRPREQFAFEFSRIHKPCSAN